MSFALRRGVLGFLAAPAFMFGQAAMAQPVGASPVELAPFAQSTTVTAQETVLESSVEDRPEGPNAYSPLPARGAVTGHFSISEDTDNFRMQRLAAGYLWHNGWGIEARAARYSAPGWHANGKALWATYYEKNRLYTLEGRLGVDDTRSNDRLSHGHTTLVGALDYMHYFNEQTQGGVSLERDVVDSVNSINEGIHYTAGALVLDHAFSDRANVGLSLGNTWFSDGNERRMIRSRWNFELSPGSGLNAYLKTRHYRNTDPYNGYYFAPKKLEEYSIGLGWRTALSDAVVLVAQGDVGRQRIDGTSKSLWTALIGVQSQRNARVQWRVALEARRDGSSLLGNEHYRYAVLTGKLIFPLD